MTSKIKCSNNDCSFNTTCINQYYSKMIGDDGYYYCSKCSIEKRESEEQYIQWCISLYNNYLVDKNNKIYNDKSNIPLALDQFIKRKYLHEYIKLQIPKLDETIIKDNIEYVLIEKNNYLELELLLYNKHIVFQKIIEKKEEIILKQRPGLNEDEREELLKKYEEHKEEVRQRPIKHEIKRKKKEIEMSQEAKQEKLDKFKNEKLPKGYKERIIKKCDYCKKYNCHPFEYMISETDEKRKKPYQGIICDYCIEIKEHEKEAKMHYCECGGKYIDHPTYKQRHHQSKKHDDWWKATRINNGKIKDYYNYSMSDLRKLTSKNNEAIGKTIINDYYKLKKEELLKKLIELDKNKELVITNI